MEQPPAATRRRRLGIAALALVVLSGCIGAWWLSRLLWSKPTHIRLFYDRVFVRLLWKDPELLTRLRLLERLGIQAHNAHLSDSSDAYFLRALQRVRLERKILRSYDPKRLSPKERRNRQLMAWLLDRLHEGKGFLHHVHLVNPLFGVQSELPIFMTTLHPLQNTQDAERYLQRLAQFERKFSQLEKGLQHRAQRGILQPRHIIDKLQSQMRRFIAPRPEAHMLARHLAKRLRALSLPPGQRRQLLRRAHTILSRKVYPAYRRLLAHYDSVKARAPKEVGLWKQPQGAAFYRYLLHLFTTTRTTPEALHALGQREIARIQRELRALLDRYEIPGKTIAARIQTLQQQARYRYSNDAKGRRRYLRDFREVVETMRAALPKMFDDKAPVGLTIRRVPRFKERSAPAAYYVPPGLDGAKPATLYLNLRDMREISRVGLRTLAIHEAIPGHHLQLSLQFLRKDLPIFRRVGPFLAFIEGWGLYTERLAWEHGLQATLADDVGRLQAELFRAARLVVDTGLHARRWSRAKAIHTMQRLTGKPRKEVEAEIDRYIVLPGQACAYTVGFLSLLELRRKVKARLGQRFRLQTFHSMLLRRGAMPLELLHKDILSNLGDN